MPATGRDRRNVVGNGARNAGLLTSGKPASKYRMSAMHSEATGGKIIATLCRNVTVGHERAFAGLAEYPQSGHEIDKTLGMRTWPLAAR